LLGHVVFIQVLGELEAVAELADDVLQTLCDEVLVEIFPGASSLLLQVSDHRSGSGGREKEQAWIGNGTLDDDGNYRRREDDTDDIDLDKFGDLQLRSVGNGADDEEGLLLRARDEGDDQLEGLLEPPAMEDNTAIFDPLNRFSNVDRGPERSDGASAYLDLAL
jgi:hypothetical protein